MSLLTIIKVTRIPVTWRVWPAERRVKELLIITSCPCMSAWSCPDPVKMETPQSIGNGNSHFVDGKFDTNKKKKRPMKRPPVIVTFFRRGILNFCVVICERGPSLFSVCYYSSHNRLGLFCHLYSSQSVHSKAVKQDSFCQYFARSEIQILSLFAGRNGGKTSRHTHHHHWGVVQCCFAVR
jgi:hypothetical protein